MARKPLFSNRTLLIIISIVTVILLLGSTILERIVLHAAQVSSSVSLDGPTIPVAPQSLVTYTITARLNGNAVVAGGQFVLSYDPAYLQFVSASPVAPWRSRRLLTQTAGTTNNVLWALLPTDDQGQTVQLTGPVNFGTVQFKTIKTGSTAVKFDQTQTIISGVDGQSQTALYNAVASVQDAQLLVSKSGSSTDVPFVPGNQPTSVGTTERILNADAVAAFNQAVIFISLKYQGVVTVRFGTDKNLLTTVQSAKTGSSQAIQLANLAANTQYYFQVSVTDAKRHATVIGQVKSFRTSGEGTSAPDPGQSNFKLFPSITKNTAELYMFVRDSSGKAISVAPTLQLAAGTAELSQVQLSPGLYVATIKSSLAIKQTVTISASVAGEQFDSESVLFNPNFQDVAEPTINPAQGLQFNSTTEWLLGGLIIIFLLSALAFIRLAKVK